jgi:hypothetical protein
VEEDVTEPWDAHADVNRAKDVLAKFKEMEEGFVPLPPKAWKCKSCEFARDSLFKSKQNSEKFKIQYTTPFQGDLPGGRRLQGHAKVSGCFGSCTWPAIVL